MFHQGDRVVHPNHGAGVVKCLEGPDSTDGNGQYYVIELYANRLTMLVPVGSAGTLGLRMADGDLVDEALAVLVQAPTDLPSEFKSRQKELMDKLRSGDTRLIAEVCRDLFIVVVPASSPARTRECWNRPAISSPPNSRPFVAASLQ